MPAAWAELQYVCACHVEPPSNDTYVVGHCVVLFEPSGVQNEFVDQLIVPVRCAVESGCAPKVTVWLPVSPGTGSFALAENVVYGLQTVTGAGWPC